MPAPPDRCENPRSARFQQRAGEPGLETGKVAGFRAFAAAARPRLRLSRPARAGSGARRFRAGAPGQSRAGSAWYGKRGATRARSRRSGSSRWQHSARSRPCREFNGASSNGWPTTPWCRGRRLAHGALGPGCPRTGQSDHRLSFGCQWNGGAGIAAGDADDSGTPAGAFGVERGAGAPGQRAGTGGGGRAVGGQGTGQARGDRGCRVAAAAGLRGARLAPFGRGAFAGPVGSGNGPQGKHKAGGCGRRGRGRRGRPRRILGHPAGRCHRSGQDRGLSGGGGRSARGRPAGACAAARDRLDGSVARPLPLPLRGRAGPVAFRPEPASAPDRLAGGCRRAGRRWLSGRARRCSCPIGTSA